MKLITLSITILYSVFFAALHSTLFLDNGGNREIRELDFEALPPPFDFIALKGSGRETDDLRRLRILFFGKGLTRMVEFGTLKLDQDGRCKGGVGNRNGICTQVLRKVGFG